MMTSACHTHQTALALAQAQRSVLRITPVYRTAQAVLELVGAKHEPVKPMTCLQSSKRGSIC